ncbi:MAG: sigma-70 family RNA polymerase sigma factor [Bacilli bacterium]|nr:sigma-70 family RNA polymerase sigma factor [Bacilli bacterium]
MEYQDNELLDRMSENSEEARDLLYDKYKYIVEIIINKYKKSAYSLSIDMQELTQEAWLGFSDALYSYNDSKEAGLATFISICVERKVENYVRDHSTKKMQFIREAISLDNQVNQNMTYADIIMDESSPDKIIEDEESKKELLIKIKDTLSPRELEVYKLLMYDFSYEDISSILNIDMKKIYDYVYHIRKKLKDLG